MKANKLDNLSDISNIVVSSDAQGKPLSYLFSHEWDFSYDKKMNINADGVVRFTYIDVNYRKQVQFLISEIVDIKTSSLAFIVRARTLLVKIMETIGSSDVSLLDRFDAYNVFINRIKEEKLSVSYVKNIFTFINSLNDLGYCARFYESPKKEADKISTNKDVNQAIAIPERLMVNILNVAVDMVEKYSDYGSKISSAYDMYFDELDRYKKSGKDTKHFKRDVGYKIKHEVPYSDFTLDGKSYFAKDIQTACMIVCSAFSGVRVSEGFSLNHLSYKEKEYNNFVIPIIEGESSKGRTNGIPIKESWVCHPVVYKALKLAYEITGYSRKRLRHKFRGNPHRLKQVESAFILVSLNESKNVSPISFNEQFIKFMNDHEIYANEEDIVEFDTLNPERKGELKSGKFLPKLSHHDFRRTFAVFVVRNRLGNLMCIKQQFKHTNIIMSAWYANNSDMARELDMSVDSELKEMIDEANISVTTDMLFDIYNSETLSGLRGNEIIKERESLPYKGKIYVSREDIEERVRANQISVVEHPTGYCFNPKCDRICSSDRSTKTCSHEVVTRDKALKRANFRIRLIDRFNALNNGQFQMGNILTDILLKIKSIELVLSDHNIDFESFHGKVS